MPSWLEGDAEAAYGKQVERECNLIGEQLIPKPVSHLVLSSMPPKRRRHVSPTEKAKRSTPSDSKTSPWGWVGTEVKDVSAIAPEHVLATCGFSTRNSYSLCPSRFTQGATNDMLDNELIVITDDEISQCSKKACKHNPNCLNYLGQEKWEDDAKVSALFTKYVEMGEDPNEQSRESDQPVGLKVRLAKRAKYTSWTTCRT